MKILSEKYFLFPLFQASFPGSQKTTYPFAFFLWAVLLGMAHPGYSQLSPAGTVSGSVRDAGTGEAIPFANVYFLQSAQSGTQTNLEGKFTLKWSRNPGDHRLVASFIGYKTDTVLVSANQQQPIHFALQSTATQLREVVISSGENPAYAIVRQAVAKRDQHNPYALEAYQMESYNRVELYLNRTEGIKNAKVVREIQTFMERQPNKQYRDAKGNVMLPITVTETVSTNYYLRQPRSAKEEILHTHTAGVGLEPEDGVTRLLSGNGFRNYNFYENRIQILDKWLPSPIADGWRFNYEYFLEDSLQIGDEVTYRISVEPRRETDMAFAGMIWINKQNYGLEKVDLHLSKNANINFVESLRIRQELEPDAGGTSSRASGRAWFPSVIDYEINLVGISKKFPGICLKVHTTNDKIVANQPRPLAFFLESRQYNPEMQLTDEAYWQPYREAATDTTQQGNQTFVLIDSIKHLPTTSQYAFWGRTLTTGYANTGKIEVGYLLNSYAWNDLEGNRLSLGARTNQDFSKDLFLEGWGAYGTLDKRFKYNLLASYVLSRKKFTLIGARRRDDTEPIAQLTPGYTTTPFLQAVNRWWGLQSQSPYQYAETAFWFENELRPGFGTKVTARNITLHELFPLGVLSNERVPGRVMTSSEVEMSVRFAKKEHSYRTRYNQLRLVGPQPSPTFALTGVLGFKNIAGSDFNYQKILLSMAQKQASILGFGSAEYSIQVGYVFSPLPYALLKVHQGNNTSFLYLNASQQMRTFEFVSDHFVELHYTHYFNSLLLSQIPGIRSLNKKLGWRLLATTNVVWGGMRPENIQLNQRPDTAGETILPFQVLTNVPYLELGYGVENIFRFLRVDFVHRLTYLQNPGISRFGIKLSGMLKL